MGLVGQKRRRGNLQAVCSQLGQTKSPAPHRQDGNLLSCFVAAAPADHGSRNRSALKRHAEFRPTSPGLVLVSCSVGPAGELLCLWASGSDAQSLLSITEGPGGTGPRVQSRWYL